MGNNGLNGRVEYRPRDRDSIEDMEILVSALAAVPTLFNRNGALVWLDGGTLKPVGGYVLREVARACLATKHLVKTAEGWTVEYRAVELSDWTIRQALNHGGTLKVLPLIDRVAKA